MDLTRRILVAVDRGAPSLRACDEALELGRDMRAELVLVHAVEPPPYPIAPEVLEPLGGEADRWLSILVHALRHHADAVRGRVAVGQPWRAIIEAAEAEDAGLVVMGTHNRRSLAHAALGSVAERVVRASRVPVMTVPAHAFVSREDAGRRLAKSLRTLDLPAPVVVALSRGALPVADVVAEALGGTLEAWMTEPVVVDGEVVGTIGADEQIYYDEPAVRPTNRRDAEARARASLHAARTMPSVSDRHVILVADALTHASQAIAAARALAPLGAQSIVLATPIATPEAISGARGYVDDVVSLATAYLARAPEYFYRQRLEPKAVHQALNPPST